MHFFCIFSLSRTSSVLPLVVILQRIYKNCATMLTYQLLKIAPDGGQFATSTLGLLFGLMETGLFLWFIVAMLVNS